MPLLFTGCVFRSGKGRGGGGSRAGGRTGGRGRGGREGRDRDGPGRSDWKSSSKALPSSLVRVRPSTKPGEGFRPEASAMPMQKIFMTNENQEQLKELLRELQTADFDEPYE